MKKLYIGFSSPNSWMPGAALIQMWQRTDYSHCYLRFYDESLGLNIVYHAAHGMVHYVEHENFKSTTIIRKEYEIELSNNDEWLTRWECAKLAAQPYGHAELAKIVLHDIANYFGIKTDFKDGRGYVCSELMGKLCVDRLKIEFKKPKHLLTPRDIDIALEKREYRRAI